MSETIKLNDFLAEAAKEDKALAKALKPSFNTFMECPTCKKHFGINEKFCSTDGGKLKKIKYEIHSEDFERAVRLFFYDADSTEFPESFPFEYVDQFESNEDCGRDTYWTHFIFKRKSDGKHFEYFMYDGRVEEDTLYEVKKVTKKKTTWE